MPESRALPGRVLYVVLKRGQCGCSAVVRMDGYVDGETDCHLTLDTREEGRRGKA